MKDQLAEIPASISAAPAPQCRWDIITCEYPPQFGGVADYTYQVAAGLAREGDEVHVWCPAGEAPPRPAAGVVVHCALGAYSPADLRRLGEDLDRSGFPRRLLVQWVPHGYGYQSMNLGFCWWLWRRAVAGHRIEIIAHEAFLPFSARSLRQNGPALLHRLMTILLLRAAARVWTTIPAWERCFRPYALGRHIPFTWIPIPSNIPVDDDPAARDTMRRRYAGPEDFLIGHFGTHGQTVVALLEPILFALSEGSPNQSVLLMGPAGERFRDELLRKHPSLEGRIHATGTLSPLELSHNLAACDVLVQPYPDGVSTRRGSVMAGISHGKPVVTTTGALTETFWSAQDAVKLAPAGDTDGFVACVQRFRHDAAERERAGRAARKLYLERFDVCHTVRALRQATADYRCAS